MEQLSCDEGPHAPGEGHLCGKASSPGAPFPPRPKAVATFLSSSDFLPGCQTLLHSVKTHLPSSKSNSDYPPEIIILLSSKLADDASLIPQIHPIFCTRVIPVDHIPIISKFKSEKESENVDTKPSHVKSWDENCGWTKLRLFELEGYDTVLYIDADCLVVKDVSHLLNIDGIEGNGSEGEGRKTMGLLAAAPDIFPPDKFNAGVMVIRPSKDVFRDMLSRLPNGDTDKTNDDEGMKICKSYDGGDTGFLNSYYPNWFKDMPPSSRLSFGYNAQRFMHHCTFQKQPNYWNDGIDDLHIIHFSSSPKPWETKPSENKSSNKRTSSESFLNDKDVDVIQKVSKQGKLEKLWHSVYQRSQKYYTEELRKLEKAKISNNSMESRRQGPSSSAKPSSSPSQSTATPQRTATSTSLDTHRLVQKRYRELRKTGLGTKEAIGKASAEHGIDTVNEGNDPGDAVGRMFGLI